ncbi:MAG: peptidoglycan DD-metalloendopeptidase family protein [Gammaproteobacteria bacterium]|nr:peptidoglycan DD-metalloendopeptidase family protein [Gammaproteobacteria bacterium]
MLRSLLVGVIVLSGVVPSVSCGGAIVPPAGPVVRAFAPVGSYAGHWGADYAIERGSTVRTVADGVVTFAGVVAGVRTVTIFHGGSLRTSYSYLASITVAAGDRLQAGDALGESGTDHGIGALHLSSRVGSRYIDPALVLSCSKRTLHLMPLDS